MWSLLLQVLSVYFQVSIIQATFSHNWNTETIKIDGEYLMRTNTTNFPLNSVTLPRRPTSVWGCDNYSAAVYVFTKRAANFAKEITNYLEPAENYSDLMLQAKNYTSHAAPSSKEQKLKVLRTGIEFYRDLIAISKILWRDSWNGISLLGEQLSDELEFQISRLTF